MSSKILVTGASRGIGRAIVKQLIIDGYEVVGACSARQSIPEDLDTIQWITANLLTSNGLEEIISALDAYGPFDGLVNNAGINRIKPQLSVTVEDYDDLFNIDLKAPYFLSKKIAGNMQNGGRIVNIASIWSVATKSGRTLYSAAKSGLVGLTKAMAAEFGPQNILVNAVSPGFTMTEMTDSSLSDDEQELIVRSVPLMRFAEPSEIAHLVSFLVSPKNTYITGQNIIIDGGFTIV